MSRIGKNAIKIPAGTDVSVSGDAITVKGKGGTLKRALHRMVKISVANGEVKVEPASNARLANALWGTYAAHVRNMVSGVNTPFVKKLQIEGIGYKAELQGKNIKLALGFSHPVIVGIQRESRRKLRKISSRSRALTKKKLVSLQLLSAHSRSLSHTKAKVSAMRAR
jgi:large subunit ribosomal protein L6